MRLYDETYDDEAAAAQDAQRAVEARAHSKGGSGMLKRHKSVMDVVLNRRQHIKELLLDEDLTSVPYRCGRGWCRSSSAAPPSASCSRVAHALAWAGA